MTASARAVRSAALIVLLLVALGYLYRLLDRLTETGPESIVERWMLPALSLAVVVVTLAVAGVLVRNLVRLIVDRKRGILGARLRTKLVFFFLMLVLGPATILFIGSAQVIKKTVEAGVRTPLEDLARRSRAIVEEWNDSLERHSLARAQAVASELEGIDDPLPLLEKWRRLDGMQLLRLSSGGRIVAEDRDLPETVLGPLDAELDILVASLAEDVGSTGEAASRIDYLGDQLVAHAAVPMEPRPESRRRRPDVISVVFVVTARLSGNLESIDSAVRGYRQFRVSRREFVRLYVTVFGLVYLVTLFAAIWIGFYLARRITGPVQELAAASREISAGNLAVRVRAGAGDELGVLVDSFNEMAGQLQESREVITRSTADLRRSNRALEERRRYIETLLADLSTAVLSLDPEGRVTTSNPAVARILEVAIEPGDVALRVFRKDGLQPLARLLEEAASSGSKELRRDLALTVAARTLQVAVHVSPLGGREGEPIGKLVMIEDLTELLRAQRAVAWREIARRIAHEIKNPLTPIQLSAQRLRKRFAEDPSTLATVLPEATASIEHEVRALERLVDEFTRFARLPEISPREVDLPELVESVRSLYRGMTQLGWEIDLEPQIRGVTIDPDQIRRALINLVDNGIAAMEGRGVIRIAARRSGPDRLVIEVSDNGPGISAEVRDRMFSPHFSTKRRGTGLGLAIVHRVVTDHQGTIRFEENEPCGARFVIELPA